MTSYEFLSSACGEGNSVAYRSYEYSNEIESLPFDVALSKLDDEISETHEFLIDFGCSVSLEQVKKASLPVGKSTESQTCLTRKT